MRRIVAAYAAVALCLCATSLTTGVDTSSPAPFVEDERDFLALHDPEHTQVNARQNAPTVAECHTKGQVQVCTKSMYQANQGPESSVIWFALHKTVICAKTSGKAPPSRGYTSGSSSGGDTGEGRREAASPSRSNATSATGVVCTVAKLTACLLRMDGWNYRMSYYRALDPRPTAAENCFTVKKFVVQQTKQPYAVRRRTQFWPIGNRTNPTGYRYYDGKRKVTSEKPKGTNLYVVNDEDRRLWRSGLKAFAMTA